MISFFPFLPLWCAPLVPPASHPHQIHQRRTSIFWCGSTLTSVVRNSYSVGFVVRIGWFGFSTQFSRDSTISVLSRLFLRVKVERPTLSNINLDIPIGCLVAVVGSIGEGKMSLVSAMLGELPLAADVTIVIRGKVAYVPQVSWIFIHYAEAVVSYEEVSFPLQHTEVTTWFGGIIWILLPKLDSSGY